MENIINKTRIALRSLVAELLVRFRNVGCFLVDEGDFEVMAPVMAACTFVD